MKIRVVALCVVLFMGTAFSGNSQILKKLKKKVEEVSQEVVKELEGEKVGKKSGNDEENVPSKNTPQIEAENKPEITTEVRSTANTFSKSTIIRDFGKIEERSGNYLISPDAQHAAIPGLVGSRQVIIVNGEQGPVFDEVFFDSFVFSPSGGRYGYVARRGDKCFIVVDGEERETVNCELLNNYSNKNRFFFSSDGTGLAYILPVEVDREKYRVKAYRVNINGKNGPVLINNNRQFEILSKGGKFFYAGVTLEDYSNQEGNLRLYINNKPGKSYWQISGLVVRDDGSEYAYVASVYDSLQRDPTQILVHNGKEIIESKSIGPLLMNVKSGTLIYQKAQPPQKNSNQAKQELVIGDKKYDLTDMGYLESPRFNNISKGWFKKPSLNFVMEGIVNWNYFRPSYLVTMSEDGKHHAFLTRKKGYGSVSKNIYQVWYNGKPGLEYEKIHDLRLTRDGQKLIYVGVSNRKSFVIVNEKEFGPFDRFLHLEISEYGNSWAFLAQRDGKSEWYVNGNSIGIGGDSESFTFSPDGSRYAFSGKDDSREPFVVVDGKVRKQALYQFAQIRDLKSNSGQLPHKPSLFVFSRDSKRLMYPIISKVDHQYKKRELVVDNETYSHEDFSSLYGFPTFSNNSKDFAYLYPIRRSGEPVLWKLYINNKPGPEIGQHLPANPYAVSFINSNTVSVLGFNGDVLNKYEVKFK